jgi:hypothetical protein
MFTTNFSKEPLKQENDDVSEGSRDDDAYPELSSLGLHIPDIASYPTVADVIDSPPNQLLLNSFGSSDEERLDPTKFAHRMASNKPHMSPMFSLTFLGISDSHAFSTPTMEKNSLENQF